MPSSKYRLNLNKNSNMDIVNLFEELGFSPNEAKIYEALLDLKEAGVGEISIKAKVHRRNAYDALNRLVEKGFVFVAMTKSDNIYSPVDPGKLLEIIREKEQNLNKALPELHRRFAAKAINQEVYIYRGIEGFKNFLRDVVRVNQDAYVIGGKFNILDPRLKYYQEQAIKDLARNKKKIFFLFDAEIKNEKIDRNIFGENYRFLPAEYSTKSTVNIFGDYIFYSSVNRLREIDDEATMFVVHDQILAESHRTWFKFLWDHCQADK